MPNFPYYPYYDESTGLTWLDENTIQGQDYTPSSTTPDTIVTNTQMKKNFFSILPRDNNADLYDVDKPISLRVVMEDGVELEPDIGFKNIELQGPYDMFKNNSGYNDSFSVTIVLHKDDTVRLNYDRPINLKTLNELDWDIFEKLFLKSVGKDKSTYADTFNAKLTDALDYWIRKGVPFYIHTDAVGISEKELWLVTENKKRKQTYDDGYVFWDVVFTRYNQVTAQKFNKITTVMEKAFKDAKTSPKAKARQKARQELAKCDRKKLVYSKKKKVVDCVKKLQQVLYLQGFLKKEQIDGWYGKTTMEAVKKYQQKWSKDYGLKVTGKINPHTFEVMTGKAKKISSKSTQKSIVNVNVNPSDLVNASSNDLGTFNTIAVKVTDVKKVEKKTAVLTSKNAKKVTSKSKSSKTTKKSTKTTKKGK